MPLLTYPLIPNANPRNPIYQIGLRYPRTRNPRSPILSHLGMGEIGLPLNA